MHSAYGRIIACTSERTKLINSCSIKDIVNQTPYKGTNIRALTGRLWSIFIHNASIEDVVGYDCNLEPSFCFRAEIDTSKQEVRPNFSWETLKLKDALALLKENAEPSIESITLILQKCRKEKNSSFALQLLVYIHNFGLEDHKVVGNYVVPMLVECGRMACALSMFHKLVDQNEFTWTSLIQGYIDCGESQQALDLFQKMQDGCVQPSIYTLQSLVKACARLKCVETGREMHMNIVKEEFEKDLIVGNTLVDLYAKCGFYEEAWSVLTELPVRDAISWNALIAGYVEHGLGEEALDCLAQMKLDGASPDEVTFICGLKGCVYIGALDKGQELHAEIATEGFERYLFVGNSLVDLYGKGGLLAEAWDVFVELPVPDVVSWNALITGYAEHGFDEEALLCLEGMRSRGVCPDDVTYVCSLKACGCPGVIGRGQDVHAEIVKEGYESFLSIGNALVDMYAKNGLFIDAWNVFQGLSVQNVIAWTALISGCAENGLGEEGLNCWEQMRLEGVSPNAVTFVCSLKNCCIVGALEKGLDMHMAIAEEGLEGDPFICSALVDMYAKCGSFAEAGEVFHEMPVHDIVLWTALIAGYAEHGLGEDALKFLDRMITEGISPNLATFLCVLKACGSLQAIERGRDLHASIIKKGFDKEHTLSNTLVGMYSKCGLIAEARALFDEGPDYSTVSWNVLISGYADKGLGEEVLNCFEEMQLKGAPPNDITLVCTLKGCSSIGALDKGKQVYSEIVKLGYEKDYFVGNTLINLYAKCGFLNEAHKLFDELSARDAVSWNAFILGYAECGLEEEVLNQSEQSQGYLIPPNAVTFLCILRACASLRAKGKGQETHVEIVKKGFDTYPYIGSILVDLYAKCGLLAEAKRVFDDLPVRDVVVWTALMAGYAQQGLNKETLKCLNQMKMEGVSPTSVTFLCSLKGWGNKSAVEGGREIHSEIIKYGNEKDPLIGSALVDMYGKCALVLEAQAVFDQLPIRLVASWTPLIAAYAEHGLCEDALHWFEKMRLDGFCPDAVTYLCCLKASGNLGVVDKGQEIHAEIVEKGMETDTLLCGALVDLYTKCGLLWEAWEVFDNSPLPNLVSWTSLIVGFASQGECEHVFRLLEKMWEAGILPDEITLLSILTVCSHVGLVEIGLKYLEIISKDFGVSPTFEHHNCVLDLLGRAGQVDETLVWVKDMPLQPNFVTWRTVLGACTKYCLLESGRLAFNYAVELDEQQAAPFILMSNIFASLDTDDKTLYREESYIDVYSNFHIYSEVL